MRPIDVYGQYIFSSDGELQKILEAETEKVRLEEAAREEKARPRADAAYRRDEV